MVGVACWLSLVGVVICLLTFVAVCCRFLLLCVDRCCVLLFIGFVIDWLLCRTCCS